MFFVLFWLHLDGKMQFFCFAHPATQRLTFVPHFIPGQISSNASLISLLWKKPVFEIFRSRNTGFAFLSFHCHRVSRKCASAGLWLFSSQTARISSTSLSPDSGTKVMLSTARSLPTQYSGTMLMACSAAIIIRMLS